MTKKIQIRCSDFPKQPRVFDVTVNEKGEILKYDLQNVKGPYVINKEEVERQIQEALSRKVI